MNHSDHCGKPLPTWSGCPLCPPLGFALRLHESIPIHESHHNFGGVSGFGLLGLADKLCGTDQYPVGHRKHCPDRLKQQQAALRGGWTSGETRSQDERALEVERKKK